MDIGVLIFLIVVMIMGIGIAMLSIWTDHQRKAQILEQQHRERMAAIEKGIPLPPAKTESSASPAVRKEANPARVLRMGVFMLSLGIVLSYSLYMVGAAESAGFGLIPGTLGLANLAYAAVLFKNERKADEEKARNRVMQD